MGYFKSVYISIISIANVAHLSISFPVFIKCFLINGALRIVIIRMFYVASDYYVLKSLYYTIVFDFSASSTSIQKSRFNIEIKVMKFSVGTYY